MTNENVCATIINTTDNIRSSAANKAKMKGKKKMAHSPKCKSCGRKIYENDLVYELSEALYCHSCIKSGETIYHAENSPDKPDYGFLYDTYILMKKNEKNAEKEEYVYKGYEEYEKH